MLNRTIVILGNSTRSILQHLLSRTSIYLVMFSFSLRLFQPQTPEEILQIESSIRTEYIKALSDRQILIHMTIKHVLDEHDDRNWYWPHGQPIQGSWWCPDQPDSSSEQSELVLNVKPNRLCFHDVGEDYPARLICNQGKELIY